MAGKSRRSGRKGRPNKSKKSQWKTGKMQASNMRPAPMRGGWRK